MSRIFPVIIVPLLQRCYQRRETTSLYQQSILNRLTLLSLATATRLSPPMRNIVILSIALKLLAILYKIGNTYLVCQ